MLISIQFNTGVLDCHLRHSPFVKQRYKKGGGTKLHFKLPKVERRHVDAVHLKGAEYTGLLPTRLGGAYKEHLSSAAVSGCSCLESGWLVESCWRKQVNKILVVVVSFILKLNAAFSFKYFQDIYIYIYICIYIKGLLHSSTERRHASCVRGAHS